MSRSTKVLIPALIIASAFLLAFIVRPEAAPARLADPTPTPGTPQLDLSDASAVAPSEVSELATAALAAVAVPGDEPGVICRVVDFEGLGNRRQIPVFDGIQSPGWLSLIDLDAGGTGNFANEPSPSTVAFWKADPPGSRNILFGKAVSEVGFMYASSVTVLVEAFDSSGAVVDSATGSPNYQQGPGGDPNGLFDKWDPIEVGTSGNRITRVRVSGNVNQTGIDNLSACSELSVYGVEFTQATQELQTLEELRTTFDNDGEPPVPIIARKPAVARVYMNEVPWATRARARLRIDGVTVVERSMSLRPGCLPRESRDYPRDCDSAPLYFVPPSGSWTATIQVFDSSGRMFQEAEFPVSSRSARSLQQVPVSVCAEADATGDQTCGDGSRLGEFLPFLRTIAPTNRVAVAGDLHTLTVSYLDDSDIWWGYVWIGLEALHVYGPSGAYYHGIVSTDAPGAHTDGIGLPRSAATRTRSLETTNVNVAHESGHMLGRNHTGTANPDGPCDYSPPFPLFPNDWPYDDNRIQETGFDLARRIPLRPDVTYDVMGYCSPPDWVSPHTYTGMLGPLEVSSSAFVGTYAVSADVETAFWRVAGRIEDGSVVFEPLFLLRSPSDIGANAGEYSLQLQDSNGTVLSETAFDPLNPLIDSPEDFGTILFFSELVPFDAAAASFVVFGPGHQELGRLSIQGSTPTVVITSPSPGATLEGTVEIAWRVDDPDSESHSAWIEYSPDGGNRRIALAAGTSRSSIAVDFDKLPGCLSDCLLWIQATDGVNTGTEEFSHFTVPKKGPSGSSLVGDGIVLQPSDLLWLQAQARDPDDGYLTGSSIRWASSISGQLGEGDDLPIIGLAEGNHQLSMTITDSDGNSVQDSFGALVDGTEPTVDLSVERDGLAARCVNVTFSASDEPGGSGLASIRYSLDGWATIHDVPVSEPLQSFTVPGSGFFDLVVEAIDNAGNFGVEEATFFTSGECAAHIGDFVLLGEEGLWIQQNAVVLGGDVGANQASDGPYLAEGSEVTIGLGVLMQSVGTRVMGDSVYLKDNSIVQDVYYNELGGLGTVLGDEHTPVSLPLVSAFPDLPSFVPGTQAIDLPRGGSLILDQGSYGPLRAGMDTSITFTGGIYDFASWDVGQSAELLFLAPTEIRIAGRLSVEQGSYLGPVPSSTDVDATDIVIYVNGINGNQGTLGATPKAAKFGIETAVFANVYVPNGTLWLRQGGHFTGAFLGRWVDLGLGATVEYLNRWSTGE